MDIEEKPVEKDAPVAGQTLVAGTFANAQKMFLERGYGGAGPKLGDELDMFKWIKEWKREEKEDKDEAKASTYRETEQPEARLYTRGMAAVAGEALQEMWRREKQFDAPARKLAEDREAEDEKSREKRAALASLGAELEKKLEKAPDAEPALTAEIADTGAARTADAKGTGDDKGTGEAQATLSEDAPGKPAPLKTKQDIERQLNLVKKAVADEVEAVTTTRPEARAKEDENLQKKAVEEQAKAEAVARRRTLDDPLARVGRSGIAGGNVRDVTGERGDDDRAQWQPGRGYTMRGGSAPSRERRRMSEGERERRREDRDDGGYGGLDSSGAETVAESGEKLVAGPASAMGVLRDRNATLGGSSNLAESAIMARLAGGAAQSTGLGDDPKRFERQVRAAWKREFNEDI